jgi:hypothetical protein
VLLACLVLGGLTMSDGDLTSLYIGCKQYICVALELRNFVSFGKTRVPVVHSPTCDTTIHRRPLCLPAPSASLLRLPLVLSPSAPLFFQRAHASLRSLHSHAHCQLLGLPSLYLRVASAKVPVRVKFCACGCCLFFLRFF